MPPETWDSNNPTLHSSTLNQMVSYYLAVRALLLMKIYFNPMNLLRHQLRHRSCSTQQPDEHYSFS